MKDFDTSISQALDCTFPSPLQFAGRDSSATIRYRQDSDRENVYPCTKEGETDTIGPTVSRWTRHYAHVPLQMVMQGRCKIDPIGSLWRTVLETTGQPCLSAATISNPRDRSTERTRCTPSLWD